MLVIDDDADIRDSVADVLTMAGHDAVVAADGVEGLRAARDRRPNVILLDLMMPVMDGWTFLRIREADPQLAAIPVVIVSATERSQLRELQATHRVLHKPFSIDDLLDAVERSGP